MDMDLKPKSANKKIAEGEAGSYNAWSYPVLGQNKVGAGILVLKPGGLAFPHYADCNKVGYVLQGEGTFGFVISKGETKKEEAGLGLQIADVIRSTGIVPSKDHKTKKEEVILGIKTGDIIPIPHISSWWYNHGNSDLVIIFLAETSNAYNPGDITYFIFPGAMGILPGFSTETVSKAFNISEKEATTLTKSQAQPLIIKLGQQEGENIPKPSKNNDKKTWVRNISDISGGDHENIVAVERAGRIIGLDGVNFPFLEEVGISCTHVKLDANAMLSPIYSAKPAAEVFYVGKGSGKVEVVGLGGTLVVDSKFESGQLLVVPPYFVVVIVADGEGMELFSINTTARPAMEEISSKDSLLNAFSSSVLQSALNVPPEFIKLLKTKMANNHVLIPPMN